MCKNIRKFVQSTPREIEGICGNCWDWDRFPNENNGQIEYVDKEKYVFKYPIILTFVE